ncbi:MAG: hypothetical protein IJ672_05160, partial [Methanobrevibacter sp.]|nr:hypothetical protein [Methanobrevibacter sp.]
MSYQSNLVQWGLLNSLNGRDETKLTSLRLEVNTQTSEDARLAKDYSNAKKSINAQYEYDDPQREVALEEVKDEFEFLKAQAANEKAEVEAQIDEIKVVIDQRNTLMDSLDDKISEEVQKDH